MLDILRRADQASVEAIREEMAIRKSGEVFLLFSLGSQFDHLIKQQLEKLGVFCLVADSVSVTAEDVLAVAPKGIILSGGPASVHTDPPPFDQTIFDLGIPVLGICLGFQLWAKHIGARVIPATHREFGTHLLRIHEVNSDLFHDVSDSTSVLESHGDRIESTLGLTILATTTHAPIAAGRSRHLWGVQFHPEVTETIEGSRMLENFCFRICEAKDRFPAKDVTILKVRDLRERIAGKRILLALSGGSDSSVVASLLKVAVNEEEGRIRAIYIRGIDRPDDEVFVQRYFDNQPWLDLRIVDATERFLEVLHGKIGMRDKRVAMRGVYKEVLEHAAKEFGADFIAQGTLYTDISESGGGHQTGARKAVIKIHHNTNLGFSLPELTPLDARNIGRILGTPEELLVRHPFPGPGMVVRIEGEVHAQKLAVARAIDSIYIEELRTWDLYRTLWQAGAVVTQSVTTCTKGDDATQGIVIALWAVWSVNGFTATRARLPDDFLDHVSRRITNEVPEVGAVVYRISDKPPATIEWG